jgi:hypothetical protein
MDMRKRLLGLLVVFIAGSAPEGVFGQAAAEAGLISGVSAISTTSAASRLSSATGRALQGQATATGKISRSTPQGVRSARSQVSVRAKSPRNEERATDHGAKLPDGIAHVWPEGALTPAAAVAPQ